MQTRKLGYSDLHLTTVGLGTWAIGGGGWAYGWGRQDDAESIAAIRRAIAPSINSGHGLGINWIDTAAVYGLGHSEEIVGRAIPSTALRQGSGQGSGRRAGRRDEFLIATKCGMVWGRGTVAPQAETAPAGDWVLSAEDIVEIDALLTERERALM